MAEKEKDELEVMNEALSKSEQFVEKYQKPLLMGLVAIIIVIGVIVGVRYFYLEPREKEAHAAMYQAVKAFENDSIDLAINGDATFMGLQAIADEYGSTDAGNLANAYLGLAYYNKGEYENAQKYLSQFESDETLLAPALYARMGDCMVELDKYEEALPHFEKAAKVADNAVYSPLFLMKAATVSEKLGNNEKALKYYNEIKAKYPSYYEGNGLKRYVERAQSK